MAEYCVKSNLMDVDSNSAEIYVQTKIELHLT